MTIYFCDTSAIIKRYIYEDGSQWMNRIAEEYVIALSEIALVEVASVFARHLRYKSLPQEAIEKLQTDFQYHVASSYLLVPVNIDVLTSAQKLLFQHKLRSLDAIQLASALRFQQIVAEEIIFASADGDLVEAASTSALVTHNPLQHV